ncbi:MAG: hypothetical protein M2R45_00567 [Verrucomicrobia subdivision 3 bacterium]|nr:hypothetical protein [Limisphaerales bacterium]
MAFQTMPLQVVAQHLAPYLMASSSVSTTPCFSVRTIPCVANLHTWSVAYLLKIQNPPSAN